jgi:DNA polymerase
MKIITLDWETYFDDEYNLKKMTTEAYVRDPRFEVLGLGIRAEDGSLHWRQGGEVQGALNTLMVENKTVLCHHAHFDGLILSHHYDVKPAMWLDTLPMARLILGNHIPAGLGALAKHFGLAEKNVPYNLFKGIHNPIFEVATALREGCLHDVELTYEIFQKLSQGFPQEAYPLIDATIRMFTEPKLLGDEYLLEKAQHDEVVRKGQLLFELGVTKKELGSNAKFAQLLAAEGLEMEFKNGKNGPIPATAKTDEFMVSLCDSSSPRIAALASARLACKSTIEETRAGRILDMAQRGPLPLYLTFAGAHTTRWSGGDKVNFQNLPQDGSIRKALRAPPGCVIAKVDAKQQECRLLNTATGQENVVDAFREGRDVYAELIPRVFGSDAQDIPFEEMRQVCKITELACGYGVGSAKLSAQLKAKKVPDVTLELSVRAVQAYRDSHRQVVELWRNADLILSALATSGKWEKPYGLPIDICNHKIILPNGFPMHYELEWDDGIVRDAGNVHITYNSYYQRPGWKRKTRNGWRRIYGAALVENIFQALGAVAIGQSVLRIKERIGLLPVLLEHDAGAWVVPVGMIDQVMPVLIEEVGRAPSWLPNAPMDAEGTYGERYGK